MVNGGRPPLRPRQRGSDPGMTPERGEGGPRRPIPAIQLQASEGIRRSLLTPALSPNLRPSFRHSRLAATHPPASSGQPSPVPPPLRVNRLSSLHQPRPTFIRPSTSSGQPPLRPHLLRPSGHLGTLG